MPQDVSDMTYRFDEGAKRWRLHEVQAGTRRYAMTDDA
jgi:hypothetical protein